MSDNLTKWVRIARVGTFKDSQGREHGFTERDFDEIKAGYDPATQEAALCFGHPKDSDPAYGWVHALKREGGNFFAQFARVPATVKKLVEDGAYRYVSMSLSPDKKRLLHVGLLGAAAPAIDGLGPVAFSAPASADSLNDGFVTINFTAAELEAEPTTRPERKRGGSMNPEELQKQIIELQRKIAELTAENEKLKAGKSEADKSKTEAEAKTAEVAAEFAAFKGQLAKTKREERVAALVKSGRLEPAKAADAVSFAAALAKVAEPVNFSAADGKTEQVSAEERYFRELEAKEPAGLALNFAAMAPAPAHMAQAVSAAAYNPADITSKL